MPRLPVLAAFASFAVFAAMAGYGWYWSHVAGRIPAAIERWTEGRRAEGLTAAHGAVEVNGFPFWLETRIAEIELARKGEGQNWSLAVSELEATARPWNLNTVAIVLPRGFSLEASSDDERRRLRARAARGEGALGFDASAPRGIRRAAATFDAIEAASPALRGPVAAAWLSLEAWHDAADRQSTLHLTLAGQRLDLPLAEPAPLGRQVATFTTTTALPYPLPWPPDRAGIAAWRDDGGVVELENLEATMGAVDLRLEGTLALDRAMRPLAALKARLRGYRELVEVLVTTGHLSVFEGAAAKIGLSMMARKGGVLMVPLTAQNGQLSSGRIRLGRLAPIFPPGR
ncbi:MAG: DUF2125 domain-containing protein [Alphaproteobacteria bacterium]|jgi:hypothetical protein|nr:DUF2125 domain-containing protein [Alphaproteobacteria bacterium]